MSYQLVSRALETDTTPTERLVLIVLAEAANKDGVCWPSVATMHQRTGLGERTIQRSIAALIAGGHLTVRYRKGTSTTYLVHPYPRHSDTPTPATVTPRQSGTPATDDVNPRHSGTQTVRTTIVDRADALSTARATEPFDAHIATYHEWVAERLKAKPKRRRKPVVIPDWLDPDAWQAFRDYRRSIRRPLTDHGEALNLADLAKLRDEGHDPAAVINQSIRLGWIALFALDQPPRRSSHGKPPRSHDDEPTNPYVRAALERQAERASGVG